MNLAKTTPEVVFPHALAPNGGFLWKSTPTPSISVGNLAMGGRGKTPVAALVARLLLEAGERPAILSRGYKRRRPEDGVVVVSDGVHLCADLDRAGDEPLLLARLVPGAIVLVAAERVIAGALAARAFGATVNVLDDGFQHRAMPRVADIVLIAPGDLAGRRAPFGRLRESPRALARASAVIVDTWPVDDATRAGVAAVTPAPIFGLRRVLGPPQPVDDAVPAPAQPGPVVVVAGIAAPERFTRALSEAGWQVAATIGFRDHHPYEPADLARIAAVVRASGAVGVLTTAKDAVRLRPLRPLPVAIAAVPLDVAVEPAEAFRTWLFDRLREARA